MSARNDRIWAGACRSSENVGVKVSLYFVGWLKRQIKTLTWTENNEEWSSRVVTVTHHEVRWNHSCNACLSVWRTCWQCRCFHYLCCCAATICEEGFRRRMLPCLIRMRTLGKKSRTNKHISVLWSLWSYSSLYHHVLLAHSLIYINDSDNAIITGIDKYADGTEVGKLIN